jgi:uncharacterized protein (TIGR02271 family)
MVLLAMYVYQSLLIDYMKDHRPTIHSDEHLETRQGDFVENSEVFPVAEETVKLDKKMVETGKVTISKKTVEHDETVSEMFRYEDVQVERIAINEYISTDHPPGIRQEDDTTIVPVLKEVVVVEKKLLLVEELRIKKKQVEKPYQTTVTLRKEEVSIDRSDPDAPYDPSNDE